MATTILGPTLHVEGELASSGDVELHGHLRGRITVAGALLVAEAAVAEAELDVESATISGRVEGRVTGRARVALEAPARVTGNLRAPRILIADGAQLKGNVDME